MPQLLTQMCATEQNSGQQFLTPIVTSQWNHLSLKVLTQDQINVCAWKGMSVVCVCVSEVYATTWQSGEMNEFWRRHIALALTWQHVSQVTGTLTRMHLILSVGANSTHRRLGIPLCVFKNMRQGQDCGCRV